jgi:hypothetical protein
MGHRMKVKGLTTEITLDERAITRVTFDSDTPNDSNARATDYGLSVQIYGRMLFDLKAAAADPTIELAKWSQVPSYNEDCYRNFEVDVISASQIVRNYKLPQAFVVEYTEDLDVETGVGTFYIHVKQKKDENTQVKIGGGFAASE